MDPSDFLKAITSHDSTRTMETEEATQQSSFSSTADDGSLMASASLDFDLHQHGSGDAAGGGGCGDAADYYYSSSASQHRYHEFRGNDSTDSFMLEDSFALGESFSCAGADEQWPGTASSLLLGEQQLDSPLRRMPRERPDLSTVIDIEEDGEEGEEEEMEEKEGDKIKDLEAGYGVHRSMSLKTQSSNISVEVQQG